MRIALKKGDLLHLPRAGEWHYHLASRLVLEHEHVSQKLAVGNILLHTQELHIATQLQWRLQGKPTYTQATSLFAQQILRGLSDQIYVVSLTH